MSDSVLTPAAVAERPASRWLNADDAILYLFLAPIALLMLLYYAVPVAGTIVNSFHPFTPAGIDRTVWTLENYTHLIEPYYARVLLRTLRVGIIVAAVTCVLAYPVAWTLTRSSARMQAAMLLVFMSPWLTNVVVKAFGLTLLISNAGLVNATLMKLGVIDTPIRMMYTELGVVIGLVHGHFLFVLLPLWAAMAAIDKNLLWAAANLGSSPPAVFMRVVVPLTVPALLTGAVINFAMNIAAFATPVMIGGSRTQLVSYLAYKANLTELNWPLGGALAMVILALTLLPLLLVRLLTARKRG